MENYSGVISYLSQQIGVTEPALRLIFTLLAGKFIYTFFKYKTHFCTSHYLNIIWSTLSQSKVKC